jgi:DNA-binding NtrC family response regulator
MALKRGFVEETLDSVAGELQEIPRIYRIMHAAAKLSRPLLILGEPGTGKEVIARAIHSLSGQSEITFIVRDCRAIGIVNFHREFTSQEDWPLTTGARRTLFLDHVEALSLDLQGSLLQILQKSECGERDASVPHGPRLMAATSINLDGAVTAGAFRKDLLFRLNALTLRVPPLRERLADIPALAQSFLAGMSRGPNEYRLSEAALHALVTYAWPRNVRELKECLEETCRSLTADTISLSDLPVQIRRASRKRGNMRATPNPSDLPQIC